MHTAACLKDEARIVQALIVQLMHAHAIAHYQELLLMHKSCMHACSAYAFKRTKSSFVGA